MGLLKVVKVSVSHDVVLKLESAKRLLALKGTVEIPSAQ